MMFTNIQIKRGLLLVVAGVAIIVLILSYPRFTSSFNYLPVEAALQRNWHDYPIRKSQFPVLIEIAHKSLAKLDQARYWQGLGWLYYLQAYALGVDTAVGQESFKHSQKAFESSLGKSPADPASWLRLSWVHRFLEHNSREVINTLKMSVFTGRAERYLILDRLNLMLQYSDDFESQDLRLIRDQIQLAWLFYQEETLELIRSGQLDKHSLLALMINTEPELVREIEDEL